MTAVLPTAGACAFVVNRSGRARRRRAAGLCPACGYDLRATPDKCPECGRVPGARRLTATQRNSY